MPSLVVTRRIAAPLERVFQVVADIREFAKVQPQIVELEILTPQKVGVGTRFRETRLMGRQRATTEIEVTEYVLNDRVRLISDAGGTIWDCVFAVKLVGQSETELTLSMEARAHKFWARLMNPLLIGMIRGAVTADVERVKAHCEAKP